MVLFNYPNSEFNEFQDPQNSPNNGVLDGFPDTPSIQNVPDDFMPVAIIQDLSDTDLFKSDIFSVEMTTDQLLKLEGLRSCGIELACSSKAYIFLSVEHIKKHDHEFEMKGPGWSWSADEGSWKEVPKPNPDFVWSSLQTWEPPCKSEICKLRSCSSGCSGLSPHFDSGKYPGLLNCQNSLYLFRGYGGNFCEQGKEKCLCEHCDTYYDPHNPSDVGYHTANNYKDADGLLIPACSLSTLP